MAKFLTTRMLEIKNYDEFTRTYSGRENVELTSRLGSLFAYARALCNISKALSAIISTFNLPHAGKSRKYSRKTMRAQIIFNNR